MNADVKKALETDQTVDITTVGRKSGKPHRIEIWFHNIEDKIYITGSPGTRDWYANLFENPEFTFHLKQSVRRDLSAKARPITKNKERHEVFSKLIKQMSYFGDNTKVLVDASPLVEVTFID